MPGALLFYNPLLPIRNPFAQSLVLAGRLTPLAPIPGALWCSVDLAGSSRALVVALAGKMGRAGFNRVLIRFN